jgi:hypothetical protein
MKSGAMFARPVKYGTQEHDEAHSVMYLLTPGRNFSVRNALLPHDGVKPEWGAGATPAGGHRQPVPRMRD